MARFIDLSGQKFGLLTVKSRAETKNKRTYWNCSCKCGNECVAESANMKSGKVSSCGCIKSKILINRNKERATHNMTGTPLYIVWDGIKKRASKNRKKNKDSVNYIDRGIELCDEWDNDFVSFYEWSTKNGYKKGLQIDRINNNEGYMPDNCRFVTPFVNSMNRRTTINKDIITKARLLYEKTDNIAEIARELNVNYSGLYQRLTNRRGAEKITNSINKR